MAEQRITEVEATLGGFSPAMRDVLVPLLLYKSHFLGDWFLALARQEPDPAMRGALLQVSRDTLREALEMLGVAKTWEGTRPDPARFEALARELQRRAMEDMLALKEGNTEAVVMAAMQAPTPPLREALMKLADRDRMHADELRTLIGANTVAESMLRRGRDEGARGAHEGRAPGRTLSATVHASLERLAATGATPRRLVVSHGALRHLRDEGVVMPDATVYGLSVEVDFAWGDECFAISTSDRVSLAEIMAGGESL
ncbi:MAG: hypothetical protein QOE90_1988 [Thermoplasmata archaeon]|nr:hypothetical protein [Thermoplasmata archaeon]